MFAKTKKLYYSKKCNGMGYFRSHFYYFPSIEGEVLNEGDVAELVAEAVGDAEVHLQSCRLPWTP